MQHPEVLLFSGCSVHQQMAHWGLCFCIAVVILLLQPASHLPLLVCVLLPSLHCLHGEQMELKCIALY
jgi:hypothetical protein